MIRFDPERKTVFGPHNLELKGHPGKCLMVFDDEIWEDYILSQENIETFPVENASGRVFDDYRYIEANGEKILLVYPTTGAAGAVCDLELLIASGIKQIVAFGTCGRLDKNIAKNTIILPTAAYREEGTSYHYLSDADEIEVDENILATMRTIFEQMHILTVEGKIWTTDAVYRETPGKVTLMKNRGCIGVDMELSALLAVSQYRNIKFAEFLIGDDAVDGETKKPLRRDNAKILQVAVKIAENI